MITLVDADSINCLEKPAAIGKNDGGIGNDRWIMTVWKMTCKSAASLENQQNQDSNGQKTNWKSIMDYHYMDEKNREIGPVSLENLKAFQLAGVIKEHTLVRPAGVAEWKLLREVLSPIPVQKTSQKSSMKIFGWTAAGLALAVIIIFAVSHISHTSDPIATFQDNVSAVERKDMAAALATIHPESPDLSGTQKSMEAIFKTYDLHYILSDLYVVSQTETDAQVHFVEVTHKISGPVFRDNRIEGTQFLKKYNGQWKLWTSKLTKVDYFDQSDGAKAANLRQADTTQQANECINNLRQIDAAANQFALEKGKRLGDPINFPSDLTPYLADGKIPSCPAGGTYSLNKVGETPTCSLGKTVTPNHYIQSWYPDISSGQRLIDQTHADTIPQAIECMGNLRQIDAAANQFALDHAKRKGDPINFLSDLTPYLANGKIPSCPAGGTYSLNKVGETPICSLSNTVVPHHIMGESIYTTPGQACLACINNLRQIDAAASQFALEHGKSPGDPINFPSDLIPYFKHTEDGKMPSCPMGGVYYMKKVGDIPTCSLGSTVTPNHILP